MTDEVLTLRRSFNRSCASASRSRQSGPPLFTLGVIKLLWIRLLSLIRPLFISSGIHVVLENVYIFIRRVDDNSFQSEITISIPLFLTANSRKTIRKNKKNGRLVSYCV